jgi:O-antigen/teichoic acid export membrane protein
MSRPSSVRDTRSAIKNAGASITALLITQGASLVSSIYLFRKLGPAVTGVYAYPFAVVTMALTLVQLGNDQPLVREVAKDRKSAGRLLVASLALRAPVAVIMYGALCLLFHFGILHFKEGLPAGGSVLMYVVWLTLMTECIAQASRSVLTGLERQEISSLVTSSVSVVRVALTILVVYLGMRLVPMGLVVLFASAAGAAVLLWMLSRLATIEWKIDMPTVKFLATVGMSFLALDVFLGVVNRFDYIYLPTAVTRAEVGLYSVSYRVYEALWGFGLAVDSALFPIIARRCLEGSESVRRAWDVVHKYLAVCAIGFALSISLLADPIMLFVFGHKSIGTGPVLRILVWTAVLYYPMSPSYRVLISNNGQFRLFPVFVAAAAVNVVLNILLVPRYGIIGSAFAMLAMEVTRATLCFCFPFRTVQTFPILRWYVRPAVAGAAMAVPIYLMRHHYHVVLVGLSVWQYTGLP